MDGAPPLPEPLQSLRACGARVLRAVRGGAMSRESPRRSVLFERWCWFHVHKHDGVTGARVLTHSGMALFGRDRVEKENPKERCYLLALRIYDEKHTREIDESDRLLWQCGQDRRPPPPPEPEPPTPPPPSPTASAGEGGGLVANVVGAVTRAAKAVGIAGRQGAATAPAAAVVVARRAHPREITPASQRVYMVMPTNRPGLYARNAMLGAEKATRGGKTDPLFLYANAAGMSYTDLHRGRVTGNAYPLNAWANPGYVIPDELDQLEVHMRLRDAFAYNQSEITYAPYMYDTYRDRGLLSDTVRERLADWWEGYQYGLMREYRPLDARMGVYDPALHDRVPRVLRTRCALSNRDKRDRPTNTQAEAHLSFVFVDVDALNENDRGDRYSVSFMGFQEGYQWGMSSEVFAWRHGVPEFGCDDEDVFKLDQFGPETMVIAGVEYTEGGKGDAPTLLLTPAINMLSLVSDADREALQSVSHNNIFRQIETEIGLRNWYDPTPAAMTFNPASVMIMARAIYPLLMGYHAKKPRDTLARMANAAGVFPRADFHENKGKDEKYSDDVAYIPVELLETIELGKTVLNLGDSDLRFADRLVIDKYGRHDSTVVNPVVDDHDRYTYHRVWSVSVTQCDAKLNMKAYNYISEADTRVSLCGLEKPRGDLPLGGKMVPVEYTPYETTEAMRAIQQDLFEQEYLGGARQRFGVVDFDLSQHSLHLMMDMHHWACSNRMYRYRDGPVAWAIESFIERHDNILFWQLDRAHMRLLHWFATTPDTAQWRPMVEETLPAHLWGEVSMKSGTRPKKPSELGLEDARVTIWRQGELPPHRRQLTADERTELARWREDMPYEEELPLMRRYLGRYATQYATSWALYELFSGPYAGYRTNFTNVADADVRLNQYNEYRHKYEGDEYFGVDGKNVLMGGNAVSRYRPLRTKRLYATIPEGQRFHVDDGLPEELGGLAIRDVSLVKVRDGSEHLVNRTYNLVYDHPLVGQATAAHAFQGEQRVVGAEVVSPKRVRVQSPERMRVQSPERARVQSPEPVRVQSPERAAASPERMRVQSPERVRVQSPEPVRVQSPERAAASPERMRVQSPERVRVQSPEPVRVQSPERAAASPERIRVQSPERVRVQSPEPVRVQSPERAAASPERMRVQSPERTRVQSPPGRAASLLESMRVLMPLVRAVTPPERVRLQSPPGRAVTSPESARAQSPPGRAATSPQRVRSPELDAESMDDDDDDDDELSRAMVVEQPDVDARSGAQSPVNLRLEADAGAGSGATGLDDDNDLSESGGAGVGSPLAAVWRVPSSSPSPPPVSPLRDATDVGGAAPRRAARQPSPELPAAPPLLPRAAPVAAVWASPYPRATAAVGMVDTDDDLGGGAPAAAATAVATTREDAAAGGRRGAVAAAPRDAWGDVPAFGDAPMDEDLFDLLRECGVDARAIAPGEARNDAATRVPDDRGVHELLRRFFYGHMDV